MPHQLAQFRNDLEAMGTIIDDAVERYDALESTMGNFIDFFIRPPTVDALRRTIQLIEQAIEAIDGHPEADEEEDA